MQALFELCIGVRDEMKHTVPDGDLTATESRIMRVLCREQGLSQKHLGDRTGTHKSQITRAFQSLQKRGLVDKVPNPRDRRSFLVSATPGVQDTLAAILHTEHALSEKLLHGFTERERDQLEQLLQRMVANLAS